MARWIGKTAKPAAKPAEMVPSATPAVVAKPAPVMTPSAAPVKAAAPAAAVTAEDIRVNAYLKWLDAGKPEGDGFNFWVEAERELRKAS
jgi:hypothetical protein